MELQHGAVGQNVSSTAQLATMTSQPQSMELDHNHDRDHRAASVLSGMSQEDMEAAETLKSLQAHCRPAPEQHPLTLIQSRTSYSPDDQQEPLFSLLTSQFPLTASMINCSLLVYRGTKSLIPGAYTVEQNVGLPLANMLGRVTGVEGGIRWALQPKRRSSIGDSETVCNKVDLEAAVSHESRDGLRTRRGSTMSEQLPPYDDAGRSPPYQEHQLVPHTHDGQTPPGWRAQLVISTSGLGVAMSEESLRSLRYCLSWLRWANNRLGGVIVSLTEVLKKWDEGAQQDASQGSRDIERPSQAVLVSRVEQLKGVVLQTLKQVVDVVSNYAGGALPENARNLVHRHITSLPLRFRLASSQSAEDAGGNESVRKVMMLAQEGLSMMGQVSGVVNDTLVSAESWCEKLGRHSGRERDQSDHPIQDDKSKLQVNGGQAMPQVSSAGPTSMEADTKMED